MKNTLCIRNTATQGLLTLFLAAPLLADTLREHSPVDPPQGLFGDHWMVVMMADQRVGYIHVQQRRKGDEIHSRTQAHFEMRRAGTSVEIDLNQSSVETIDGTPLAFTTEQKFSQIAIRQKGTIGDGKVKVVTEQFGQEMHQEFVFPAGALMDWGSYLAMAKHEPTAGTVIQLDAYIPSQALNVAVPTRIEVLGREEIDVLGEKVVAIKTKSTTKLNGVPIEAIGWVDENWTPIRQEMNLLGIQFQMIRCDKEYALQDFPVAEVFVDTLISLNKTIERDTAQSITFKFSVRGEVNMPDLPETEMQKVISRDSKEIILKVSRMDHDALRQAKPAVVPSGFDEYLNPSIYINSDDQAVVHMSKSVAGDPNKQYDLAAALCRKVAHEIVNKDLGTAFATAAEVCRKKSGDCTEHGVLLAALGRARGIPTRVVTGLIYVSEFAGRRDVLGFHMWTQFWIGGKWIDLDAAWEQVDVDPTHIALGIHSLEHGSIGDLFSSMMLSMGEIKISVVDIKTKP